MPRFACLLILPLLAACTTFDAGPPPVPRGEIVSQPVTPTGIRPLTEDQRTMLDG